jgi:cell division protein FtsQ
VESERRGKGKPRRPASKTAGRRLSDAKREERERRQREIRVRRTALIAALVLGVVLLCWGALALYRAPIFTIKDIRVSGAAHYKTAEIEDLAKVPNGVTLIRVPASEIEARLEQNPWIADAEVARDFPSTLRISVRERRPAAVVDAGGDKLWLVSTDGHWLGLRAEGEDPRVLIQDVKKFTPRAGAQVKEREITNATKILAGLSENLAKQVVSVSAPSVDETALRTKDDIEIFVGEATEMVAKSRIVSKILAEHKGVVYINVRVTDRPTWRGLSEE